MDRIGCILFAIYICNISPPTNKSSNNIEYTYKAVKYTYNAVCIAQLIFWNSKHSINTIQCVLHSTHVYEYSHEVCRIHKTTSTNTNKKKHHSVWSLSSGKHHQPGWNEQQQKNKQTQHTTHFNPTFFSLAGDAPIYTYSYITWNT